MSKLTVIIPVLNGMPYLPEMLASLENQTFQDFILLLWDNGSTDASVEEAKKWIPSRLPGRIVSSEPLPLHECLARMVEESKTDYCARIDADDIALPDRFKKQMDFLLRSKGVEAVGGQMQLINAQSETVGMAEKAPTSFPGILFNLFWRNPMPHPAIMFRRAAVIAAGNYRVKKPVEDYDLWLRMSLRTSLANLPDVVLQYRIHDASICSQENQSGALLHKMVECSCRYASSLFQMSEAMMKGMLHREKLFLLPHWEHLLNVVSKRTGASVSDLRLMSEFQSLGRATCHPCDYISRFYLAVLGVFSQGGNPALLLIRKLCGK